MNPARVRTRGKNMVAEDAAELAVTGPARTQPAPQGAPQASGLEAAAARQKRIKSKGQGHGTKLSSLRDASKESVPASSPRPPVLTAGEKPCVRGQAAVQHEASAAAVQRGHSPPTPSRHTSREAAEAALQHQAAPACAAVQRGQSPPTPSRHTSREAAEAALQHQAAPACG